MNKVYAYAGWAAVINFVLSILVSLLVGLLDVNTSVFIEMNAFLLVLGIGLSLVFALGIVTLARKEKIKHLEYATWARFALVVLTSLSIILFTAGLVNSPAAAQLSGWYSFEPHDGLPDFNLTLHIIGSIIYGAVIVYFGFSLYKLKDKYKHAKTAGMLEMIGGATLVILVGSLLILAAILVEALMLFNLEKSTGKTLKRKSASRKK